MLPNSGERGWSWACRRLLHLLRAAGPIHTATIFLSALDDKHLKLFDRRYRIRTSGFIRLQNTSFDPRRLPDATQYGPVNGWGFRRLLRVLKLPKELAFVDFGCGLGRACILAAEYGFARVTGVDLAPELCAGARENLARCRPPAGNLTPVSILQMDVLEYCDGTNDDVFFMFRPFSGEFLQRVLQRLSARAQALGKPFTIIYTERMAVPDSFIPALAANPAYRRILTTTIWGQAFYVFELGAWTPAPAASP